MGIPTVKWKEYDQLSVIEDTGLWTVRVAIEKGDDLNLPRVVGVNSNEAMRFARSIKEAYKSSALVIYYPYFIAIKSGTLKITTTGYVIEAVEKDLWNLVSENKCDVTIINNNNETIIVGNPDLVKQQEIEELRKAGKIVRYKFRDLLFEGKEMLLEWSYAIETSKDGNPSGEQYLVFYELRTI